MTRLLCKLAFASVGYIKSEQPAAFPTIDESRVRDQSQDGQETRTDDLSFVAGPRRQIFERSFETKGLTAHLWREFNLRKLHKLLLSVIVCRMIYSIGAVLICFCCAWARSSLFLFCFSSSSDLGIWLPVWREGALKLLPGRQGPSPAFSAATACLLRRGILPQVFPHRAA